MIATNTYNVTLQAVVNVRIPAVEAATPQEAIQAAQDRIDLHRLFRCQRPAADVEFTEFAEELGDALVDLVGDAEYEQSHWFVCNNDGWVPVPAGQIPEPVAGPTNGPAVKQASQVRYCRTWKCPDCGQTVEHSYVALAEVGTPICPGCDEETELI